MKKIFSFHTLKKRRLYLAAAFCLLIVTLFFSAGMGAVSMSPFDVFRIAAAGVTGQPYPEDLPAAWGVILFKIRFPRVLLGAIVGMTLAVAGSVYQALFRNPLAEPYLVGVSSGASFGATLGIIFLWRFSLNGITAVSLAAFVGALLSILAIYSLARIGGKTPVTTLILAGVALSSILSSCTSFLMFTVKDAFQTLHVLEWLMGSLAAAKWDEVFAVFPLVAAGLTVVGFNAHTLNVMQLDDHQVRSLGIPVEKTRLILLIAVTLATAAVVSVSGTIGFIGLIVPHMVRLLWGSDYKYLMPMSAIIGAILLILADTLARTLFAPREFPIGVVTSIVGAPFFLYLLRKQKKDIM